MYIYYIFYYILLFYLFVVTTWVPDVGGDDNVFTIDGASSPPAPFGSLSCFFSASGSGCLKVGFGELIMLSKSPFCTCSTFLKPSFGLPFPVTGFFFGAEAQLSGLVFSDDFNRGLNRTRQGGFGILAGNLLRDLALRARACCGCAEEFAVGQEFRSRAVFDNADFSTGYRRGRGVFVAFATGQCESSGGSAKQDGGEFHVHGVGVFNVCLLLELQLACQLRSNALQIWPILRLLVQGFD